jgi:hypothetical protein
MFQSDEYAPKYFGYPRTASYITHVFETEVFPRKFEFKHRLIALWTAFDHHFFAMGIGNEEYEFLANKFPDFPTPVDLFKRLTYVFRNSNELLMRPQPQSAKTK